MSVTEKNEHANPIVCAILSVAPDSALITRKWGATGSMSVNKAWGMISQKRKEKTFCCNFLV